MITVLICVTLLGFSISFVPTKAEHILDPDYRLPQNYFPETQNLNFKYFSVDRKISAKTFLQVENVDNISWKTITLHSYQLDIKSVQVLTAEGDEIANSFRLVDRFEILEITLQADSRPQNLNLTVAIDYENLIEEDGKLWGMYSPWDWYYEAPKELVTYFQPAFARTVFPTYDEPLFRFKVTFSIEIHQDPEKQLGLVLFNSVLTKNWTSNDVSYFHFKETVPLPAYLVEISVLKPAHYVLALESSYFNIPIRVISDNTYYNTWLTDKVATEKLDQIIKFTLTYCESRFEVRWKMSEKIDILITQMPGKIGGMEHPGLIVVSAEVGPNFPSSPSDYSSLYTVVIHELVHQWTGGLLTNDWWSYFWLNEGFTTFFQSEITRELIKFHRLPLEANKVDVSHGLHEFAVVEKVDSAHAKNNMEFWGFTNEFYFSAMRAVSLLDAAMGNNLMVCLGVIFVKYPFRSFDSKSVLDQISQCPYSTINATEFMRFWLFDEEIPVLKINVDNVETSEVTFSYDFMCSIEDFQKSNCFKSKPNFKPHFALTFRDHKNMLLQDAILVSKNNTEAKLQFELEKYPIFFVNTFNQGNFLVQYPEHVYKFFFPYLQTRVISKGIKLPPFYKSFVSDMFELSRRNRTSLYWTFAILMDKENLTEAGVLDSQSPVNTFTECLEAEFFAEHVDPNDEIWKFACQWSTSQWFNTCEEFVEDTIDFPPKQRNRACIKWVAKFAHDFRNILESSLDMLK